MSELPEIPDATVARLPIYRRSLVQILSTGERTASSADLADLAGVNAAKVRKDLSYLGTYGVRGVGYDAEMLITQIDTALGLEVETPVVIVGMGNLGQALAHYGGFQSKGFPIVALVDASRAKVGQKIEGLTVTHFDDLSATIKEHEISVGIIATPAEAAQGVCDALVDAGVRSILTFAPTVLQVPETVPVRKVDLATELQILGYYQQREIAQDAETA